MGFSLGDIWSGIKSAAKKVGDVITSADTWKRVGDIGGKVVGFAKQALPFVENIPIVGQVAKGIAGAGQLVDLARQAGSGDLKGAALGAARLGAGMLPGAAGTWARRGVDVASRIL